MTSPVLLSLLLTAQTPDYEKAIAALEEAYRASEVPEVLLSIAATYERWPSHCAETLIAYKRFFDTCGKCEALARGVERFDQALERCAVSPEEENAIREQYRVPARTPPAHQPGDATRIELVELLRRGRTIDRTKVNSLYVTLIEVGLDASTDRLNALREEAWGVLLRADADPEQVLSIVARVKDVDMAVYRTMLLALMEAGSDDQTALNAVRAQAIAVLRQHTSTSTPGRNVVEGCVANPLYEVGYLTINTDPWSEVYVNGQKVGTTPLSRHEVIAGCVTVRAVSRELEKELVQTVTVRPNKTSIYRFNLRKSGIDRRSESQLH